MVEMIRRRLTRQGIRPRTLHPDRLVTCREGHGHRIPRLPNQWACELTAQVVGTCAELRDGDACAQKGANKADSVPSAVSTGRISEISVNAEGTYGEHTVEWFHKFLVSDGQELSRHFTREQPGYVGEGMRRGEPGHLPTKGTDSGDAAARCFSYRP
ncbi:hypothetical protein GCM10009647_020640 [Streptomyces sanglieri]